MRRRFFNLGRVRRLIALALCTTAALCGKFARGETKTTPSEASERHPLTAVLRFARQEHEYLQQTVRDYTCRIVKRERINGALQPHQSIRAQVRPEGDLRGAESRPLAVLLAYEGPREIAGRRVLYVQNAYDDLVLVRQRRGGITLRVRPDGGLAARESAFPITTIGIHSMMQQAIEQMEDDLRADPAGENTTVELFRDAKIDGRPCTAVRILHPRRQEDLDFHLAHVFIDDESHLPVRLDFYDWAGAGKDEPMLLGEFTYLDVKINVGLSDADFDAAKLGFHVNGVNPRSTAAR